MSSSNVSTSIVDVPKKHTETDLFGIDRYSRGLIKFIRQSDTPITIAIQGEWGSGKTSLMNTLRSELSGIDGSIDDLKHHNSDFYGIWINTWQYSLLQSHEQTLVSIVTSVANQVAAIISARHQTKVDKISRSVFNIVSKLGKGIVTSAAEQIGGEKAADVVIDIINGEQSNHSIKQLRDSLQEAIIDCLNKDKSMGFNKKGFAIFVDDLDRIDPPVAVQILELLKNIFDLEYCVFILAIDYDVVIKGLKPKFGELNEKNEREFRSFFDKIIQMPFSMPVASYNIDRFLIQSLIKIGYLNESKLNDSVFSQNITSICNLSVGNNPRSLKRLLNTVSLINIIGNETNETDEQDKEDDYILQLNFALICIQIAFPALYKILCMESDFKKWDQKLVTNLKLRNLTEEEVLKLSESEEFDEEWERILYRICERDNYLSNKVVQISQLFNLMSKLLPEGEELSNTLNELLALASVTDVQAYDKPKQAINNGPVLKMVSSSILPILKKKLRNPYPVVRQQSKKVVSNLYLSFSQESWRDCIGLSVEQIKDQLALCIWHHPWSFKYVTESMQNDIKKVGLENELNDLICDYKKILQKYSFASYRYEPMSKSGYAKGWHVPYLTLLLSINSLEELSKTEFLNNASDLILDFMDCNHKLKLLAEKYESIVGK